MSILSVITRRWARILSSYPRVIIILVLVVDVSLIPCLFWNGNTFSFDDPLRGFEARHSYLANKINTWKLMTGKTYSPDDVITLYPITSSRKETLVESSPSHIDEEEEEEKKRLAVLQEVLHSSKRTDVNKTSKGRKTDSTGFCGQLSDSYVQFVVEPNSFTNSDLFSLEYLEAICLLDKRLRSLEEFSENCESPEDNHNTCCKSWTLPNLIARAVNKSDCMLLESTDVIVVQELLDACVVDFQRKRLHPYCFQEPKSCSDVPAKCFTNDNLVHDLLYYVLESQFVDGYSHRHSSHFLKRSNIFLPVAKSSQLLPFFHELHPIFSEKNDWITIASLDIGLKDTMFERLLVEDTRYLIVAFVCVVGILWLYSRSFLVVLLTSMNLVSSLGGAFLIYKWIYGISFFPFMNLMTTIILIAVGTDSTFILISIWYKQLEDKGRRSIEDVLVLFLSQSWTSTLLTNGTTALALLASLSSDITSLQCFSVFSATAVFVFYLLTSISIPAVLFTISDTNSISPDPYLETMKQSSSQRLFKVFNYIKFPSLLTMTAIAVGGVVLLFQSLEVPSDEHFSTFNSDHPFETFDIKYRDLFKFSQRSGNDISSLDLPITIVFGVLPEDTGSSLDPFDHGSLVLDTSFNPSTREIQEWMLSFCHKLRNVSLYRPAHGPLLSNCFIETFKSWVEDRPCFDAIASTSNRPCCNESHFPFDERTFKICVSKAIDMLHRTPTYIISRDSPGVRFSRKDSQIAAIVIQYFSNFSYSSSYKEMKNVMGSLKSWFDSMTHSAPSNLQHAWFVTDHLELFALQDSLISGTYSSVMIGMILAFSAVILVTQDFSLTLCGILTIASIISTTLATLFYFFSWQINVIESVVIVVAIGIAVDLPLHFTLSFINQDSDNLSHHTTQAIMESASPLLAAASTTLIGGLCMMPSQILAYTRVGTFLIVISIWNVLYTFLFLTPLLFLVESWTKRPCRHSQTEFLRSEMPLSEFD